jgi:hypothetical protein
MKNSREKGNQAALFVQHEAFGIPDSKEILITRTPEQSTQNSEKISNIIGLSEDVRHSLLKVENQRLKALVEDLILDKTCQARRITELNRETSRLKKVIADLILDNRS